MILLFDAKKPYSAQKTVSLSFKFNDFRQEIWIVWTVLNFIVQYEQKDSFEGTVLFL